MKRISLFLGIVLLTLEISAQSLSSSIQYTETFAGGTARSTAMAGAYGALGADFASASQNPAGLGFYRSSELTFTPELFSANTDTRYHGGSQSDNKLNFNLNNLGYVAAYSADKTSGLSGLVFSVGYNRLNNYHNNILLRGINPASSLADFYTATANTGDNGYPVYEEDLNPYDEKLFWEGYLFDYDNDAEQYYVNEDVYLPVLQRRLIEKRGRLDEWTFSLAANYSHILYFGATFGIRTLNYDEASFHTEFDPEYPDYRYFSFYQNVNEQGTGYTGKLGIIVKPINEFRVGMSIHLPTVYFIDREEDANLRSIYTDPANYTIVPTDNYGMTGILGYSYRLTSPAKLVGSVAVILGKMALISADIEYTNYENMEFSHASDNYDYTYMNMDIQDIYKSAINVKTGVEIRLEQLRLRGGVGYYDSPYVADEINEDSYTLTYSAGTGFRMKNFFWDFTYMYQSRNEMYNLYSLNGVDNLADLDNRKSRFLMTFGFRF